MTPEAAYSSQLALSIRSIAAGPSWSQVRWEGAPDYANLRSCRRKPLRVLTARATSDFLLPIG
jgi:hypothetical protein